MFYEIQPIAQKDTLVVHQNLEQYAPHYEPERFSPEEKVLLAPFFSNTEKPVYTVSRLPEEVIGALASRYSRAEGGMRRVFLREYLRFILNPEEMKKWQKMSDSQKNEAYMIRDKFNAWMEHFGSHGDIGEAVNQGRAREFFDQWLSEFGDDSIAEQGDAHVFIEGVSNLATNIVETSRIGLSAIEKSSRYVSFGDAWMNGSSHVVTPGELQGTVAEGQYVDTIEDLFDTYRDLSERYLQYIMDRYPKFEGESDKDFAKVRGAKRFDDIRDLLPMGTQTNYGLNGNARAYENLINRLLSSDIGEARWLGQAIYRELGKTIPSMLRRIELKDRGGEVQEYRSQLHDLRYNMSQRVLKPVENETFPHWVQLLRYDSDADVAILTAYLSTGGEGLSTGEIQNQVEAMSYAERAELLKEILDTRNLGDPNVPRPAIRFRKPPRSFEHAYYTFSIFGRLGDYRDLHRHRMQTSERGPFTTRWGYDLEPDLLNSPFADQVHQVLQAAGKLHKALAALPASEQNPRPIETAQYAIPFAFIQDWEVTMNARQLYLIGELRTGSQGRDHYRKICQQLVEIAMFVTPSVMQGLRADFNHYDLARRGT